MNKSVIAQKAGGAAWLRVIAFCGDEILWVRRTNHRGTPVATLPGLMVAGDTDHRTALSHHFLKTFGFKVNPERLSVEAKKIVTQSKTYDVYLLPLSTDDMARIEKQKRGIVPFFATPQMFIRKTAEEELRTEETFPIMIGFGVFTPTTETKKLREHVPLTPTFDGVCAAGHTSPRSGPRDSCPKCGEHVYP